MRKQVTGRKFESPRIRIATACPKIERTAQYLFRTLGNDIAAKFAKYVASPKFITVQPLVYERVRDIYWIKEFNP
jgi:hypothetical protein